MPARAEYDEQANALYVYLSDEAVSRSIPIDDYRVIDLDSEGKVRGLEVLYPTDNLQISTLAREYGFADRLLEIDEAISIVLPGVPAEFISLAMTYTTVQSRVAIATSTVSVSVPDRYVGV